MSTTMRRKYRFSSRELAEQAVSTAEQRSLRLFWMICATESGSLCKVGRKGDYSITFIPSPSRHSDFYCLQFAPKGNRVPDFQFFEGKDFLYQHLSQQRIHMNSKNPESVVFDCLMTAISEFVEPA